MAANQKVKKFTTNLSRSWTITYLPRYVHAALRMHGGSSSTVSSAENCFHAFHENTKRCIYFHRKTCVTFGE